MWCSAALYAYLYYLYCIVFCVWVLALAKSILCLVNPRRAHAQRGLLYLVCVCVSVCLSVPANLAPQAKAAKQRYRGHCFKRGFFPKTASFKSYGVKHQRKTIACAEHGERYVHEQLAMHVSLGLILSSNSVSPSM